MLVVYLLDGGLAVVLREYALHDGGVPVVDVLLVVQELLVHYRMPT